LGIGANSANAACILEVPWILMQHHRQHSPADHDLCKAIRLI
jgi:hypothetical protein